MDSSQVRLWVIFALGLMIVGFCQSLFLLIVALCYENYEAALKFFLALVVVGYSGKLVFERAK